MVIREAVKSKVTFIPECTCNKKLKHVKWSTSRFDIRSGLDESYSYAEDHEELHKISRAIVDYIADSGKMGKEDIIKEFPQYNEGMLSMAANLSMYPIVFPKRRHAPPQEFETLKQHALRITEEFRKVKYDRVDHERSEETIVE